MSTPHSKYAWDRNRRIAAIPAGDELFALLTEQGDNEVLLAESQAQLVEERT